MWQIMCSGADSNLRGDKERGNRHDPLHLPSGTVNNSLWPGTSSLSQTFENQAFISHMLTCCATDLMYGHQRIQSSSKPQTASIAPCNNSLHRYTTLDPLLETKCINLDGQLSAEMRKWGPFHQLGSENKAANRISQVPTWPPAQRGEPEAHTSAATFPEPLMIAKSFGWRLWGLRCLQNGLCGHQGHPYWKGGVCSDQIILGSVLASQAVYFELKVTCNCSVWATFGSSICKKGCITSLTVHIFKREYLSHSHELFI